MDIFTAGEAEQDFSQASKDQPPHLRLRLHRLQQRAELRWELDSGTEIEVYAKLPKASRSRRRLAATTPDWAIAFKQGAVKHVYFVAETKGSMSSMEFRKIEETKIECARKFFAKITSDQVKYEVVNSYGKLMELVH